MNIHCISYASNHWLNRITSFKQMIEGTPYFDDYQIYGFDDLDTDFRSDFHTILEMPRGGGYWIWKSQIIKQHLKKLNEGDILYYADIGCSFNNNKQALSTFNFYNNYIANNSILRFCLEHKEKGYTNTKTINFFAAKYNFNLELLKNSNQLMATIMGFKKDDKTIKFLEEFYKCLEEDKFLITDTYNSQEACQEFKDHRHDQSMFSLLHKCMKYSDPIKDHTYSSNWTDNLHVPITATRKGY